MYDRWGNEVVDAVEAYFDGNPVNLLSPAQPMLDLVASRWGS
jgi:hypothetical protein